MAGRRQLEGFVKERNSTQPPPYSTQQPPQLQNGRTDRAAAAVKLKVKRGEKGTVNHQAFGLSALASGHNPNLMAGRSFYSNMQYKQDEMQQLPNNDDGLNSRVVQQHEQILPVHGGAFDDTITSDLEVTTSDLAYDSRPRDMNNPKGQQDDEQYNIQATDGRNQYVQRGAQHDPASNHPAQRSLQHKQTRLPLADTNPDEKQFLYGKLSTHAIENRFARARDQQWQQEMPDRGGNVPGQQRQASNKREHPDEQVYSDDSREYDEQRGSSHRGGGIDEDEDDRDGERERQGSDLPGPGPQGEGHFPKQENTDPRSEGVETVASTPSEQLSQREEINKALHARLNGPHRHQLDHSDEKLKSLAYAELKQEPWDTPTSSQKRAHPHPHPGPAGGAENANANAAEYSFKDCIEYTVLSETAEFQIDFFAHLSLDDFEQAGDVFIEKFAELMRRIREARRRKRDLVAAFEGEIEAREKAVRGRSNFLDTKLGDMRAGGEGVLRGNVKIKVKI